MSQISASLTAILDLEPLERNLFRGRSPKSTWPRVFGGQVIAQSLYAACKTVEGRQPHSLHAYFLLAGDPEVLKLGRSIYANSCATCHGSSAQGANGFPNLSDDIWDWGGDPERVLQSVLDGRDGVMPEWGQVLTGMGGEHAVDYTVAYVRALATPGQSLHNDYMAARGKKLYDGVCVACHGVQGKGNQELGAPDLTDDYWMYGSSKESLRQTIISGRHGIMPAHRELLGETRARLVSAYVWSLSNRPAPKAATPAAAPAANATPAPSAAQ